MEWMDFVRWFSMGFSAGLGFLVVSTLYRLIIKQ